MSSASSKFSPALNIITTKYNNNDSNKKPSGFAKKTSMPSILDKYSGQSKTDKTNIINIKDKMKSIIMSTFNLSDNEVTKIISELDV